MEDLSYFLDPVEVLITEEVGHFDEETQERVVDSPAVYETQEQERSRGQGVSHSDLVRIIEKHKGNPKHLDAMIAKQQESVQWEWYDKYQEHLEELAEVVSHNAGTTLDEEGVEVPNEPKPTPVAPVRPPVIGAAQWKLNNYSLLRQQSYGTWQEQMDMLYEDQVNGTTKFRDAINVVKNKHGKPV